MRVAARLTTLVGAVVIAAGLWGIFGWPGAALFLGASLLFGGVALSAELAKKDGGR